MVRSMLGPYQYKTRVARLRLKGFPVYEFGERVMQEGSFGDDVMQLQAYLSEQGYFSSEDGLSGYFGSVTGDALQAWQGDHGLRVTGVFDADSKWTYLKQQEAAVHQTVAAQQAQPVVVVRPPSVPESWRVAQPGLSSGLLGLAALVAGTHLARTRLKDARRVPGVAELGRVLRWTVHTLAGATALANRALLRAVLHALEAQPDSPPPQQRRRPATAPASSPAPGSPLVDEQSECGNAAAALAARQVAAEEAAYLAAMAAVVAPASPAPAASPKPARRLSEDELQQRIAVMKGEVSPRTPVPQRSPPRKLPLGVPKPTDGDRITGSKYGTYYGGRQVRDSVKEYLDGGAGPGSRPANTPARRMEANGYQIGGRPRPASKPAKPAPAHAPAPVMAALAAPAPEVEVEVMAAASGPETFRDVEAAAQQATAIGSGGLLNGTELEKSPERRGPPVPVVKPGMASPSGYAQTGSGSSAGNGGGSPAAAAPRPVAVVKPQKRATIGDMLRNSRVSDEYPPHPGQSGTGRPQPGGYDFAAVPPPPAQQQPEPAAIRRRPVDTGSSYGTRSAAVMSPEASAAPAAVQYNTDGSIVLSSKPIKLHKPAHLLPKTIGFQEAASERGPAAAASPLGQQLASSQQNFFGGPISRDY